MFAISTKTGSIKFYDSFTGTYIKEFNDGNKYRIKFTSDENKLVLYDNSVIKILNVETLEVEREITNDTEIRCLDISQDGTKIAIGDEKCRVIDLESGETLATFSTVSRYNYVESVCFDPNLNKLFYHKGRHDVSVIDLDTNEEIDIIETYKDVNSICFSPDGTKLVLCERDSLAIRDSTTYEHIFTISEHCSVFFYISFSPDSSTIALINFNSEDVICFYDTTSGLKINKIKLNACEISCLNFDESGDYISFVWGDKLISSDVRNGDVKFKIEDIFDNSEGYRMRDEFVSFPRKSNIGSYI